MRCSQSTARVASGEPFVLLRMLTAHLLIGMPAQRKAARPR